MTAAGVHRGSGLEAAARIVEELQRAPFLPHRILRGPHAMTFGGWLLPRWGRGLPLRPRRFATRPGVEILAHESRQPGPAPILVLNHGLEGSSASGYMVGVARRAHAAGFHVVRLNQRGCGGTFDLTDRPYHAGLTEDLEAILRHLDAEEHLGIFLAGFSLGGNQVLKLLGELGDAPPSGLRGAAAVSVPIDLASAADALHRPGNRAYERFFVGSLRATYGRFHRRDPARYSPPPKVRSLREFDDRVAGPVNGFRGADDYYARSSSGPLLARIAVPTLLLQAEDDPMIPFAPFRDVPLGGAVRLWATPRGGHLGFLSAGDERHWAEATVVAFVRALARDAGASPRPPIP